MCSGSFCIDEFRKIKTAAASVVTSVPILKHVMGIFGLIDASKKSIVRHMKKGGAAGSIVIYIGGIAELFKSSRKEERLYLSKRKGFIKVRVRVCKRRSYYHVGVLAARSLPMLGVDCVFFYSCHGLGRKRPRYSLSLAPPSLTLGPPPSLPSLPSLPPRSSH